MNAALWILFLLFLVLLAVVLRMAHVYRNREIGDGGMGIGLVMLFLECAAVLDLAVFLILLLVHLAGRHP
jgi:hypothetical protein